MSIILDQAIAEIPNLNNNPNSEENREIELVKYIRRINQDFTESNQLSLVIYDEYILNKLIEIYEKKGYWTNVCGSNCLSIYIPD